MVNLVNGRKLAELAGCSAAAVTKARKAGSLPERDDGLYDLADEKVLFWTTNSGHKRGASGPELGEALRVDEGPADAMAAQGEAQEAKAGAPRPEGCAPELDENALRISAKFDGAWLPIARFVFDPDTGGSEMFLFPLPRPLRFVFNYGRGEISAAVREIVGGALETYLEASPRARAAALGILNK